MIIRLLFLFIIFVLVFNKTSYSDVIYMDPMPGAKYVNVYNSIIISLDREITGSSMVGLKIEIRGSKSGLHTAKLVSTSDKKKILYKTDKRFEFDETVTVRIDSKSNIISHNSSNSFSYTFHTEKSRNYLSSDAILRSELGEYYRAPFKLDNSDPPELTVSIFNNPSEGRLFFSNLGPGSYLMITENNGDFYFTRGLTNQGVDFKMQYDGTLTYFETAIEEFYQMDSNYQIIDTFVCGNGYRTDIHELILLPNNHALLMSYDPQIVDMSQIVQGGDTAATVIGLIIQELDENKNVVFQWRSWDHFEITDATNMDFTSSNIDYSHGNAIEMDNDGHLMISSRNMDEITKINRNTGEIIWRLGGKNNDFTFINDPIKFSRQHDIRRVSNGNVTLYDNGNFHTPSFSRAVEYKLDEVNKTAELVWEYRNNPSIYAFAMGNTQRLDNGNTIIGWGYTNTVLSEVTPEGEVLLEMKLPTGFRSYRSFKFNFPLPPEVIPETYILSQNYPNPFNPSTTIDFSLPVAGNISIKIYDMIGREIQTLFSGQKRAGNYSVVFEASGLSSGVYFYKITAGDYTATKKMVLMK